MNLQFASPQAPPAPRYYQAEAIDALHDYFDRATGNPLVAMPTGTGKSLVIGGYIYSSLQRYTSLRALMLTRSQELVKQNYNAIQAIDPFTPVGIYSAGLKKRETHMPITYGNVQSVVNAIDQFGYIDVVIVDEAHLISPKDGTQFQTVFSELKRVNPLLKVIGFSATIYRRGQGYLTEGDIFTDVAYNITDFDNFNRLVSEGYLAPLVSKPMQTTYDLSGVRIQGEDYHNAQLEHAVNVHAITYGACAETVQYGIDRQSWLVFAVNIQHAEAIAETLRSFGIVAVAVHNKAPDRDKIIEAFKRGEIQCVVNVNILTTGFDHPGIDLIACMRPTTSTVLWVQMLGRGTRPAPNKDNCLVLDFARNTEELGPINDPVIPQPPGKKKSGGGAPFKTCEACGFYNHTRARICEYCHTPFPENITYDKTASHAPVMITERPSNLQRFEVNRVMYAYHKPLNKGTPTLRVNYICGFKMFSKWVPIEHPAPARNLAVRWWKDRSTLPPPDTVNAALALCAQLTEPEAIIVDMSNKKRPEVKSEIFKRVWQQ